MLQPGRRLFGTDGVRGVANRTLTADFALALGRAAGDDLRNGPVVVGRDTRRSGEMLSSAIQAGFHSVGVDTLDVGVMPSGGVAHITATSGATMGVIISASHNPAPDNGIKFLSGRGFKLSDEEEDVVERRFRRGAPWRTPVGDKVGTRFLDAGAANRYLDHLVEVSGYSLRGLRVSIDAANGAAFQVAPELFARLKADLEVHAAAPDGTNINDGVGATHPEFLAEHANGRIGLCFDGDADRLIAVDEDGLPANGDVIMAIVARYLRAQDRLKNDTVVTTVMANLGFRKAMAEIGVRLLETKVGDRYVLEAMREANATLGGEQSGHVIFLEAAPTGDGLLTAVKLMDVVAATGKELRQLRKEAIVEYPQVLRNVPVQDAGALEGATAVWDAVAAAERGLGSEGRVLVRASGTEPLVRVMVEAATDERAARVADELVAAVSDALA